jgi:hypothetical protein
MPGAALDRTKTRAFPNESQDACSLSLRKFVDAQCDERAASRFGRF